jgi:inhibitor of cysteine peptidase
VPGEPLDQFALDEYEDTLRITTTIPRAGDAESINHLYVLDSESLDRESEVTGMGEDQRVYAVRYVGDTAYLITFRRVDPFYVVDFEEPTEPELLGDLKLPGFSTYLHPIDDDTVLGIGEENRQVKAVLFDVTEPTDPEVGDDLVLDERWSAIDNSHHAFLIDRRHGVFFLPAEEKGLVVNYTGGELEVVAEVQADSRVSRARYVDDYLYVFAGEEVIVLDQSDWERTTTLTLGESN